MAEYIEREALIYDIAAEEKEKITAMLKGVDK